MIGSTVGLSSFAEAVYYLKANIRISIGCKKKGVINSLTFE